ncbi:amino acid ABC transporter substrate-binding protein [Flaviaesturariibacter flavus]|uniref:Amino acid ABC transporter substrate-binding protein n=1 Tax=Flaviaesturariibacter flavus TaxID=2502780 RepID=A0A4R1BKC8_9BACT|nr:ABC transporter substrate-binding protein [Flaviaesturariibacter flavus]TCJ17766.1 amino acid ABC transporter substrate-binding protein [Flaviaesturariibacter flavus]
MTSLKRYGFLLLLAFFALGAAAQQRQKIVLFSPLYLDSAFDAGNNYRFNTSFPKYLNPGLEFYLGAQAALDSLNRAGAPLEVHVVDLRSSKTPLARVFRDPALANAGLFIAPSNPAETRQLAEEALRRKIPFVSATLPNDAGVTDNPYYVVLNSTLRTHCEALYRHYQKVAPNDHVVLFTRPGTQEAQVKEYFLDAAKSATGKALSLQVVDLGAEFDDGKVVAALDSTRRNICIAGSLDEDFASELAAGLTSAGSDYKIQLAGMPTWDGLPFRHTEFKGLDILYTTPFWYAKPTALQTAIAKDFSAKQNGRATDLYYRGYETMLRFALLLLDSRGDMASNLPRKGNNVFTTFDIQPVFLNRSKPELDYFENKHLYFIRVVNGVKSALP